MSDDYKVGYGRPPKSTRFRKGESGNPKGRRPKEARSITLRQFRRDVLRALETEIDANVPGQPGKKTVAEMIVWKQIQQALQGDHRSAKLLFDMRREFTEEHMRLHPEVMEALETGERMHGNSDSSDELNHHSTRVFNKLRKLTQKV